MPETEEPIMAPAVLKSIAISAGYSAKGIDLNAELISTVKNNSRYSKIEEFLTHNNLHSDVFADITNLIGIERTTTLQQLTNQQEQGNDDVPLIQKR